jgi:hypothetical protein
VLRHEVRAVNQAVMDVVAKFLGQRMQDDLECVAPVMRHEVLDILQQEGPWALRGDYAGNVEEKRPLRFILETVGAAQLVLAGNAGAGKGLAGKAAQQHVVSGISWACTPVMSPAISCSSSG